MQPQSSLPAANEFFTPVYGTVFAGRAEVVQRLTPGDVLILVPDPPGIEDPNVWVHARGGDVIGHLRPDIGGPLSRWMLQGGRCTASVVEVGGENVASWRRLVIRIERLGAPASN